MWPWGHAAVAYLCYALSTRTRFDAAPGHGAVLALAVGSQFPDLVDKPLAWYLGVLPTGRSLAHSLLVLIPLSIAAILLARRLGRGEYGVAFAIGALSHTLADALPVLWRPGASADFLLWPVVSVTPEDGAPTVLELLLGSTGDPSFYAEFVLLAVAFVWWLRDGYPGLEPIRDAVEGVRHRTPS